MTTQASVPGPAVRSNEETAPALRDGRPVVALESTIFSHLGLPAPFNSQALDRVMVAVRAGGAVPGLTAVLDGEIWCGVPTQQHSTICGPADKVAKRDVAAAVGRRAPYGATTVSASVAIAEAAGVETFATGGIGGVHRGWSATGDVSADLSAIADHRVVTVSAGAKSFLDLPATLERLDTLSVPVIGWRTNEFPAFYARSSELPVATRVESAVELAGIARTHWALGGGGILVVNPVLLEAAIDLAELDNWTAEALQLEGLDPSQGETAAVAGPSVTPRVLSRLVDLSGGRTLEANLALAESNASVAAEIASALAVNR